MEIKKLFMLFAMLFAMLNITYGADDYSYAKLSETLLNQDPDPAVPGEYVELRFKVEKEGNEKLENIKYELITAYPFSFDNSDSAIKYIGDWRGFSDTDEYATLYYKLYVDEDAVEGTYNLTLVQTSSNINAKREIEFEVRIDEKNEANLVVGNIVTTPSRLIADYDEGLLEVEIVNNGDDDAKQVIAKLNLPEGFEESFGYSNIANLGTIEAGETKTAKFYIDTNEMLDKGTYPTTVSIDYKEANQDLSNDIRNITLPFNIKVFGKPHYEIKDVVVEELYPGVVGKQIRLMVENIGSKASDTTSIQVFKDSSQPFSFSEKSEFIGSMEVGDSGQAVFLLDVKEAAIAKDYKVKLQIRSVVDSEVFTQEETIDITIANMEKPIQKDGGVLGYVMYGIVGFIGAILGFSFARRKRKVSKKLHE